MYVSFSSFAFIIYKNYVCQPNKQILFISIRFDTETNRLLNLTREMSQKFKFVKRDIIANTCVYYKLRKLLISVIMTLYIFATLRCVVSP